MDDDDPGAGYALFQQDGGINNLSPHGALRAYAFAGQELQVTTAHDLRYLQFHMMWNCRYRSLPRAARLYHALSPALGRSTLSVAL